MHPRTPFLVTTVSNPSSPRNVPTAKVKSRTDLNFSYWNWNSQNFELQID